MISVVLFDGNVDFITDLNNKLRYQKKAKIIVSTRNVSELEMILNNNQVDVLIFGPSLSGKDAISLGESVSAAHPDIAIIFMSTEVTTELLRDALRAGAKDVLPASSMTGRELFQALKKAYEHCQRVRKAAKIPLSNVRPRKMKDGRSAKVVTFFSAKGGVGKTFIAANAGVGLAKQTNKEVALIDLNLQFGDVGVMLQLQPKHTIYEAASAFQRLDADLMRGFLTPHPSGVRALLAPVEPDKAEAISSEEITKIISTLKGMCDYLLIDTPPTFNDNVLAALDISDEIILVASLDVPSLKNTKLTLNMLELLKYPREKIKILLNRANSRVRLNLKDVERALGTKAAITIPSDIVVPLSVNKGIPIVTDAPRTAVARNLLNLVREIDNGHGGASIPGKKKMRKHLGG